MTCVVCRLVLAVSFSAKSAAFFRESESSKLRKSNNNKHLNTQQNMTSSYKEEKEAFVSNLQGTNFIDLIITFLHIPVLTLLAILLLSLISQSSPQVVSSKVFSVFTEYLTFVIPVLLCYTIGANYNHATLLVATTLTIIIACFLRAKPPKSGGGVLLENSPKNEMFQNTHYVTLFKGFNVFLTCLAILAVDFTVFPRRFGKTETFGLSLMDTGVGLFMISSAMTSKFARGVASKSLAPPPCPLPPSTEDEETGKHKYPSWRVSIFQALRHAPVLFLKHSLVLGLGLGRLVLIDWLQYQKHVSEYGYHWNFFVTLFCVWFASDWLHGVVQGVVQGVGGPGVSPSVPRIVLVFLAGGLLTGYQYWLLAGGGSVWLLDPAHREENWVAMNKEGLCSLPGYLALYLLTEALSAATIFSPLSAHTPSTTSSNATLNTSSRGAKEVEEEGKGSGGERVSRLRWLVLCTAGLFLAWAGAHVGVQRTSRRLCNASYVLLALALAWLMLSTFYWLDAWLLPGLLSGAGAGVRAAPRLVVLRQCNTHSLYLFLLANLATGLVNLTVQTLYASPLYAMGILAAYALGLTLASGFVDEWMAAVAQVYRRIATVIRWS